MYRKSSLPETDKHDENVPWWNASIAPTVIDGKHAGRFWFTIGTGYPDLRRSRTSWNIWKKFIKTWILCLLTLF